MMNRLVWCAAILLIGCSGGGGLDASPPHDLSAPDLSAPDLGNGGKSCAQVAQCYFLMGCTDQSCLDLCTTSAATKQFGMDARSLYDCTLKAQTGACASACNGGADGGLDGCQGCVTGSCDQSGGVTTCSGGPCSAQAATCANDD